jgi:hypothetical protein
MLIFHSNSHYNKQKELISKVIKICNKHNIDIRDTDELYVHGKKPRLILLKEIYVLRTNCNDVILTHLTNV